MMRDDTLNWHDYGAYTEMNSPSLTVCSTDKEESKQSIVNDTLSHNCSTDKSESRRSIVRKTLSQSSFTDKSESKLSIVNKTLSLSCSTN